MNVKKKITTFHKIMQDKQCQCNKHHNKQIPIQHYNKETKIEQ